MKLKRKISKAEFDALDEVKQSLYLQKGEDYILDIDDTAFTELKAEKASIQKELDDYKAQEEERIKKAEERARKKAQEEYEKAKNDKDVEAIEKSWTEKYEKLKGEKEELDVKHTNYVKKSLIETAVSAMANEISTSPLLLTPHIRSRLDVDFTGAEPKLIVLDDNGGRSALTIDELKKSFIDNKEFSAIIKATSANGGAKAGIIVSGTQEDKDKPNKLGSLSDQQLAQWAKSALGESNEE